MPEPIDLKELLKKNPKVDAEELSKGLKLGEDLRRARMRGRQNRFPYPFIRRRAIVLDDLDSDPRVTRLSSLNR
jgi:hypothetical protein